MTRAQRASCRTASAGMKKLTGVFLGLSIALGLLLVACGDSTDPAEIPATVPTTAATEDAVVAPTAPTTTTTADAVVVPTAAATATTVPEATKGTATPEATTVAAATPRPTVAAQATEAPADAADELENKPQFVGEAVVPPPVLAIAGCAPGASTDEQKTTLVKMAEARFAGMTVFKAEEPRLHYPPEARDHRQGGIWLVVEFNGDDVGEVADKKASLDLWMTEAYDLFFNSGCNELTQVDLSGYGEALGRPPIGPTVISHAIVFKTRMKKAAADTVDWASKDTLDFEEVWDVQIINVRWKRELAGLPLN